MLLRDHGQGSGARGDKRELHLRGAQPHAPRAIVVAGHCGQGCAEEEAVGAEEMLENYQFSALTASFAALQCAQISDGNCGSRARI